MKLDSVCVYCGSSVGRNPAHAAAAERLGVLLAEMLAQLATVHMPEDLRVGLRVTGPRVELPGEVASAAAPASGG